MRRLGIFFFYDSDGVVDEYVEVLLKDMVKNLSELCIVVNGYLNGAGFAKFSAFTDKIIVRENKGLDVWAYKTALARYGWDNLVKFDEIVLFNHTIMGPVYPFSEMYSEMERRDIDFWGITWFHKYPNDPFGTMEYGYIPRHIQSHFMAYRRSLVESSEFQNYWDEMPEITSYEKSIGYHEASFKKRFEDLGFKSDIYVNTEELEGYTYQPILFAPKKLIAEYRCPIFKRRSFFHDYLDVLNQSAGTATRDLYEYLRDETDYDVNLIWDNALRSMNLADIVKNLHLDYVLPTRATNYKKQNEKIAFVLHLYYMDLLTESLSYINNMPADTDIFITVGSGEKVQIVQDACKDLPYKCEVRLIENRGRDVSALLVGVKDIINNYDLVCFAHDKKVTQLEPYSIGDGFARKCFENLVPTQEFVSNVLELFATEPRLGLLTPPQPNHAEYFPGYGFNWGKNFTNTEKLLQDLQIKVPLTVEKEAIAPLGTMFWFRPAALRPLFDYDWDWDNFPPEPNNIDGTLLHAVERAYGYVAQSSGYFTAWLYSDRFAEVELTNLEFYTRKMIKGISPNVISDNPGTFFNSIQIIGSIRLTLLKVAWKIVPRPFRPLAKKTYRSLKKLVK